MKPTVLALLFGLLAVVPAAQSAESAASAAQPGSVHPAVQQALNWSLPANECRKPRSKGTVTKVSNEGADSGARSDVDSYTLKRFKRKEKRWMKCVDGYKEGLKDEFETLRGSAQHGLTQDQATTIMGKMKLIQSVLMTHDGLPPEQTNAVSAAP